MVSPKYEIFFHKTKLPKIAQAKEEKIIVKKEIKDKFENIN